MRLRGMLWASVLLLVFAVAQPSRAEDASPSVLLEEAELLYKEGLKEDAAVLFEAVGADPDASAAEQRRAARRLREIRGDEPEAEPTEKADGVEKAEPTEKAEPKKERRGILGGLFGRKDRAEKDEPVEPAEPTAGETPETGGEAAPVFVDPERAAAEAKADELAEIWRIDRDRQLFLSARHLEAGQEYFRRAEYEKARDELSQALRWNPENADAKRLISKIDAWSGRRPDEVGDTTTQIEDERLVQMQMHKIELDTMMAEGKKLMAGGEYAKAAELFRSAKELVRWAPGYMRDFQEKGAEAELLLAQALKEADRVAKETSAARRAEAAEQIRIQTEREAQLRQSRISFLLDEAKQRLKSCEYKEAAVFANKVLAIDPGNPTAENILRKTEIGSVDDLEDRIREDQIRGKRKRLIDMFADTIPPEADVVYPVDWEERTSQRDIGDVRTEQLEPWKVEIQQKMQQPVSFNFVETPIEDVVTFLREMRDINIILDPLALTDENGMMIEKPVTLKVNAMKFESALGWILKMANLDYSLKQEAIFISTPARLRENLMRRTYNVVDLTSQIQDFAGPKLQLGMRIGESDNAISGGGMNMGEDPFGQEQEEDVTTGDNLVEMIRATIDPGSWGEAGGEGGFGGGQGAEPAGANMGSIRYERGQLIIHQTPDVHRQVDELLSDLRREALQQVAMEIRYIILREALLRDIGISFKGLNSRPLEDAGGASAGVLGPTDADADIRIRTNHVHGLQLGDSPADALGGLSAQATVLKDYQVEMILNMIEKEKDIRLVTAPRLMCMNSQRANLRITREVSYVSGVEEESFRTSDGSDQTVQVPQTSILRDGVVFDVRPTISADRNYITLELRPQLSQVVTTDTLPQSDDTSLAASIQTPEMEFRVIETTVSVPSGGTVMLGGLKEFTAIRGQAGVPFLGNIPLLKVLFRRTGRSERQESLYILVTAEVVE